MHDIAYEVIIIHMKYQVIFFHNIRIKIKVSTWKLAGAQWLSGRVLDSRPKGRGFEPHRRHCVVSLSKNINPSLVLVQPRKTRPFITERLLMGRKVSNQTNKHGSWLAYWVLTIHTNIIR